MDNEQTQPGADTSTTNTDQVTDTGTDQNTDQNPDVATLQKQIADLRKEAAGYRTKLRETEKAAALQQPTLENATARIAELENALTAMRTTTLHTAITAAAGQIGFIDPKLAVKLIDTDGLDPADTSGILKALNNVAKESPFLIKQQRNDAASLPADDTQTDMNALFRRALKK